MSPKIALALLICSCVVLGLAYADSRPQQRNQQRYVQRNQMRNMQQHNKGFVNSKRRMVQKPTEAPGAEEFEGNGNDYGTVDETPSTQKPLATYNRDVKRPNH